MTASCRKPANQFENNFYNLVCSSIPLSVLCKIDLPGVSDGCSLVEKERVSTLQSACGCFLLLRPLLLPGTLAQGNSKSIPNVHLFSTVWQISCCVYGTCIILQNSQFHGSFRFLLSLLLRRPPGAGNGSLVAGTRSTSTSSRNQRAPNRLVPRQISFLPAPKNYPTSTKNTPRFVSSEDCEGSVISDTKMTQLCHFWDNKKSSRKQWKQVKT